MNRTVFAAVAAISLFGADASAKTNQWCMGTFVRDTCAPAGGADHCSFPKRAGNREEFMGWEIDDGVKAYAVYRLAAYPAKDVRLDAGCKLQKY